MLRPPRGGDASRTLNRSVYSLGSTLSVMPSVASGPLVSPSGVSPHERSGFAVSGTGIGGAPADQEDPRADLIWGTVPRLVDDAALRHGNTEALVDGDVRLTYAQLAQEVDRYARAFVAAGVGGGDRVALWAPNCAEWMLAALGLLRAGAVLVPLNTRFKGGEAAYILRDAGASTLVTVRGFLGTDYPGLLAGEDTGDLARTVLLRDEGATAGTGPDAAGRPVTGLAAFLEAGERVDPAASAARAAAVEPDDVSDLIFTSGTTGQPKGAAATHAQSLRTFGTWSSIVGLGAGDRYLVVNPFFHTFGYKAGILACLMAGRHRRARAGLRRGRGHGPHRRRAHQRAARTAHALPDAAERSPAGRARPVVAPARRHRRGRRAGRARAGDARRARLRHRPHRVRAHRVVRDGHHVPSQRPARDRRRHVGSGHSRAGGAGGGRGRRGRRRRAGRDRRAGLHRDAGLLGQRGRDGGGDRRRGLAAHRRHRGHGRRGQRHHHRPGQGHVRRGRLQRLPGRDRGHSPRPRGRGPGGRGRRARRADGGGGLAYVVPARAWPAAPIPSSWDGRSSAGHGGPWPTTKSPAASSWSMRCR